MYFPTPINWTSPFPILGLLGGIFHFHSNFKRNGGEPDQTLHFAASDLVLHCLQMSHKKDPRLLWVKLCLGSIGMGCVISEACYKETFL